jgi:hypothetical protein
LPVIINLLASPPQILIISSVANSNPSLIELQKGTIVQKLHWNDASKLQLSNNK